MKQSDGLIAMYSNRLVEERFQSLGGIDVRVSQRKGRKSDLISVGGFPVCRQ